MTYRTRIYNNGAYLCRAGYMYFPEISGANARTLEEHLKIYRPPISLYIQSILL